MRNFDGTFWWYILMGYLWWDTLWDILMGYFDGTYYWDFLIGHSYMIFCCGNLMEHFDGTFWWDILIGCYDGTFWWNIMITFDDRLWQLMTVDDHWWPLMTFDDHWWPLMTFGMVLIIIEWPLIIWQFWLSNLIWDTKIASVLLGPSRLYSPPLDSETGRTGGLVELRPPNIGKLRG